MHSEGTDGRQQLSHLAAKFLQCGGYTISIRIVAGKIGSYMMTEHELLVLVEIVQW